MTERTVRLLWYRLIYYMKVVKNNLILKSVTANRFPLTISIEAATNCNLRCHYCYQTFYSRREGLLNINLIEKLTKNLSLIPCPIDINFDLGGEPFLNPALIDMINYFSSCRSVVSVTTNGTLLDRRMIEQIVNSNIFKINFSIDIIDGKNIRYGSNLSEVIDNIDLLLTIRKELRRNSPIVTVRAVGWDGASRRNINKLLYGKVRLILISPPTNWSGLIKDPISKNHDYICLSPWMRMAMLFNGDFILCCNDPRGEYVVGKFPEQSIEEIWRGDGLNKLRKSIICKDFQSLKGQFCGDCSMIRNGVSLRYYIYALVEECKTYFPIWS